MNKFDDSRYNVIIPSLDQSKKYDELTDNICNDSAICSVIFNRAIDVNDPYYNALIFKLYFAHTDDELNDVLSSLFELGASWVHHWRWQGTREDWNKFELPRDVNEEEFDGIE